MQFGQSPRDWQTKPGSLTSSGEPAIDLAERFDREVDFRRGHSRAAVSDLEIDASTDRAADRENHSATGIRKLNGVTKQVQ